jgi:hypothetical protein
MRDTTVRFGADHCSLASLPAELLKTDFAKFFDVNLSLSIALSS